jgi:hypothetical protein
MVVGLFDLITSAEGSFGGSEFILQGPNQSESSMSFVFGLQKTRDSLKDAFESLFEKYGKDFDDDDEIDILSLEVVKKSLNRNSNIQRPRKFGFLYQKKGI